MFVLDVVWFLRSEFIRVDLPEPRNPVRRMSGHGFVSGGSDVVKFDIVWGAECVEKGVGSTASTTEFRSLLLI